MTRPIFAAAAALAAFFASASPALAERLAFDHRLAPQLKAVLDSGRSEMISYNDKNPRHIVDLIAVRGTSASDWTEALVIVARTPDQKVRTAAAWMAELRADADRRCASTYRIIAEDAASVTFERSSIGCRAGFPETGIYRAVAGKRSLFLLEILVRDELSAAARRDWLSMLASARIE